jgi:peptidoglycan/xylan/chitin deacetylase (PgdA/CDA1 family)
MLSKFLNNDSLTIFLFHGVVEKCEYRVRNYNRKHIEVQYFEHLMHGVSSRGAALSLEEVVDHHVRGKRFPAKSFAVTFDDGFENNYSVAAPVLEKLHVPAAFYVTSAFIEHNGMSWIDRVECCMERAEPKSLLLPWESVPRVFGNMTDEVAALEEIRRFVKASGDVDVEAVVQSICSQCCDEAVTSSDDPLDRKMDWKQVASLDRNPLFTVGGHTHSHAILSFLSREEMHDEIRTSLALLKEKAGVGTRHYSYPEGQAHCFSDAVIHALKSYGVVCCPTAMEGVNTHETDLFHLRRIMVT